MSTETLTLESLSAIVQSQQAVLDMHQSMNMEVFYWWCTALMLMIHAGFLAYEMGASRGKNALAAGIKNILALAMIIRHLADCLCGYSSPQNVQLPDWLC